MKVFQDASGLGCGISVRLMVMVPGWSHFSKVRFGVGVFQKVFWFQLGN